MQYRWVAYIYREEKFNLDDWIILTSDKDSDIAAGKEVSDRARSLGFDEIRGWWIVMDWKSTDAHSQPYDYLKIQEHRVRSQEHRVRSGG